MLPDRNFFFELADAASAETLPRFRTGVAVTNKQDGGYDPVTEGDQAAESAIRLHKYLPKIQLRHRLFLMHRCFPAQ